MNEMPRKTDEGDFIQIKKIGNSLGLRARAKNVVTITDAKIAFGTDMGWIIDRETGAMGLSSFVCRVATKAF